MFVENKCAGIDEQPMHKVRKIPYTIENCSNIEHLIENKMLQIKNYH